MSNETNRDGARAAGGGIGLCGAMFLIFMTLKLTGHIDWSWFEVTAPLWVPLAGVLAIIAVLLVIAGAAAFIGLFRRERTIR